MERRLPKWARTYFTLLAALAALCVAGATVWFAVQAHRREAAPQYLLKDSGGHLALYTAEGAGPLAEYDIYTRLLPEGDVLALQQGVSVQDEHALQQLLEDYGL